MRPRLALALLLALAPAAARAEDAPERLLPAGTQLYVRWDGIDAHRAAYAQTGLGKMLAGDTGAFAQSLFRQISAEEFLRGGASTFWKNGTRVERIHIFNCYLSNYFCHPAELLRRDFKRVHGGRFYTD